MIRKWVLYGGLIIIIVFYLALQLNLISLPNLNKENNQVNSDDDEDEPLNIEAVVDINEQDEEFSNKDELILLIMDSTDYFQQIQATVEQYDGETEHTSTIYYAIDTVNNISISSTGPENTPMQTVYFNSEKNQKINIDEQKGTYQIYEILYPDEKDLQAAKMLTGNERIIRGLTTNKHKAITGFAFHLVNSELVLFLQEYEEWEFSESVYNHLPAYKITGTINPSISESNAGTFEMYIHKDTGIVLAFYNKDNEGNNILTFETKDIQFNEDVDSTVFIIDLNEYEKME